WKHGQRILVDGNIFSGLWTDVSGTGCALEPLAAFNDTPRNGSITDLLVSNNTVLNSSCFVGGGGGVQNAAAKPPAARFQITNNLLANSSGWQQYEPNSRGPASSAAYPFFLSYGLEDVIID